MKLLIIAISSLILSSCATGKNYSCYKKDTGLIRNERSITACEEIK